jgi:hypothetical protein
MKKYLLFLLIPMGLMYANVNDSIDSSSNSSYEKRISVWSEVDYWHIEEGGLGFVFNDPSDAVMGSNQGAGGDLVPAKYDWAPGFKVGFGYAIPNHWGLDLSYGYYRSHNDRKVIQNAGFFLYPAFQYDAADLGHFTLAQSDIRMTLNFGDVLLKEYFQATKYIELTLINGMGSIWSEQNWINSYFTDVKEHRVKLKWAYKGAGPKFGLNIDWECGQGFSLTSKGTFCAMMGNYDNRTAIRDYTLYDHFKTPINLYHFDDFRIVTHFDVLLGASWEHEFDKFNFRLLAAYELNVWDNVQEIDSQLFRQGSVVAQPLNFAYRMALQGATLGVYLTF